jgi:hypothetical protein
MLLLGLGLIAADPPPAAKQDAAPSKQMQTLLQNCDAHKFETIIEVTVNALPKHSRVKLCGTEGQSDADWVGTLKDAVAKTKANPNMPPAVRDQIVTAIDSEIARLNGEATASAKPVTLPPPRSAAKAAPVEEYAALPPLPTAPPPPVHLLPGASPSLPLLSRPRMTFVCFTPGEVGDGPCTDFARDTLLTVRADEDLPGGTSLRFVLGGDARADVELAQLRRGKTMRFALPPEVCSHIGGGSLEIRIVRSAPAAGPDGQEVGKDGPYNLRC